MTYPSAFKNEILEKVRLKKLKKTEAAEKLGVSRKTIHLWLNNFRKGESSLSPVIIPQDKTTKETQRALKNDILRVVVANPSFGPQKIAKALTTKNKSLSTRSVWLALKKLGLNTRLSRKGYVYNYKVPQQTTFLSVPGHVRLNPEARKRVIEKVVLGKEKVKDALKELHMSRKTFAKWKKRYQEASSQNAHILPALFDRHLAGQEHPRAIAKDTIKKVIELVVANPKLSTHTIAKTLGSIGNHGVQNILKRNNLSTYQLRLAFANSQQTSAIDLKPQMDEHTRLVWQEFMPNLSPAPPTSFFKTLFSRDTLAHRSSLRYLILLIIPSLFFVLLFVNILQGTTIVAKLGLVFASLALSFGTFFFIYSLKYYATIAIVLAFSRRDQEDNADFNKPSLFSNLLQRTSRTEGIQYYKPGMGLHSDLSKVVLARNPFVSIHISTYNEKRVIDRLLTAVTSMEYENYEVIVADDSTDETIALLRKWEKHPRVKIVHRLTREGFKGGALKEALKVTNPDAEFIAIFDADFIPYPDTIVQFVKYFQYVTKDLSRESLNSSPIAAVQGYQWHVLNKSENWVTRGVRSEYAGSYVIERSGAEIYSGLKQIAGSVYMIRREILEHIGWGTSITEDFQLTLKLYEQGYKVVYTPYIQTPAEAVSTIKRFIRQRMRWAEGHSYNVRKMFTRLIFNDKLAPSEKLEFVYLAPYYLQSLFFIFGTLSWFLAEVVFQVRLPFWTDVWGWSLVFTNLLALPLMNLVGLFLEDSEQKDYIGLFSFIALSYIVAPFQGYAALKGFLEKEEGPWFRTPKTGRITDTFTPVKVYRYIKEIFGKRSTPASVAATQQSYSFEYPVRPFITLEIASEQSEDVTKRYFRRNRWTARCAVAICLIITLLTTNLLQLENEGVHNVSILNMFKVAGAAGNLSEARNAFAYNEEPTFRLELPKQKEKKNAFFFGTQEAFAAEVPTKDITTKVYYRNQPVDAKTSLVQDKSGYVIHVAKPTTFKPGKYTLEARVKENGKDEVFHQDFGWGVLAMNTEKSIYTPGETIHFGFGVVDDVGETVCDATMKLTITVPSEKKSYIFSTADRTIQESGKCARESVTNTADYLTTFMAKNQEEVYKLHLEAETYNGQHSIDDTIQIVKSVPFVVSRSSYPTRIYPKVIYPVKITVVANQAFTGTITEKMPPDFDAIAISDKGEKEMYTTKDANFIRWQISLKKGEAHTLSYTVLFPLRAPAFYQVGPLIFTEKNTHNVVFVEKRQWQIAADAIAFVQFKLGSVGTTSPCTVATTTNLTAGNLAVVSINILSATVTANSISDTLGNTWVAPIANVVATANTIRSFYALNITGGADTISVVLSADATAVCLLTEYSGVGTSNSFDQKATATDTSATSHTTASVTTFNANEVLYVVDGSNTTAGGWTAGTNYTLRSLSTTARQAQEDRVVSVTGSYSGAITSTNAINSAIVLLTFSDTAVPENPLLLFGLGMPLLYYLFRRKRRKKSRREKL